MSVRPMLLAAALPLLAACASAAGAAGSPPDRAPGEPFTLAMHDSAHIATTRIEIRFARLVSDSRCPTGAQCITAGEAVIELTLTRGSAKPASVEITTTPGGSCVTSGDAEIELQSIEPVPALSKMPKESDYRATLVVRMTK
jgi:hypothetical protein